ncbi:hypothetical protein ACFOET_08300 [Parapedobacter deserti]|uniref:Four helix bundle protein n=1 Tax=Parapedobacter deserti TaxID=1912957 RepID=A0ABV7JL88_9SPHI
MTIKEAFEVSAGRVFMELAKKIGREKYLHYLEACGMATEMLMMKIRKMRNPIFKNAELT